MHNGNNLLETDLVLDNTAAVHLKESAGWGKFLGIVGFIISSIVALIGVFAGVSISRIGRSSYSGRRLRLAEGSGVLLLYLAGAAILFFMSLYLYRFAKKTRAAITSGNRETITEACKNLKIYFRFAGITSIISIVLMMLCIIGIIMAETYSRY